MRKFLPLVAALGLAACSTVPPEAMLDNAEALSRIEGNGDTITEYRVGGQLKMVKVTPARGAAYYIYDRNSDGIVDDRDRKEGPLTYYKLFSW